MIVTGLRILLDKMDVWAEQTMFFTYFTASAILSVIVWGVFVKITDMVHKPKKRDLSLTPKEWPDKLIAIVLFVGMSIVGAVFMIGLATIVGWVTRGETHEDSARHRSWVEWWDSPSGPISRQGDRVQPND